MRFFVNSMPDTVPDPGFFVFLIIVFSLSKCHELQYLQNIDEFPTPIAVTLYCAASSQELFYFKFGEKLSI